MPFEGFQTQIQVILGLQYQIHPSTWIKLTKHLLGLWVGEAQKLAEPWTSASAKPPLLTLADGHSFQPQRNWARRLYKRVFGYTGLLPSWKGQCFVLTGVDSYLGYGFAFSVLRLLPKLPSVDLENALLLLIRELTSQQKKCGTGPMLMGFTGRTMFPITVKELS